MASTEIISFQNKTSDLPKLINQLVDETYPALFENLSNISVTLTLLAIETSDTESNSIPQRIFSELDAMFRKEKYVLFPYIKTCYTENKKTGTCAPFKTVKLHAGSILFLLQTIKRLPGSSHKENACLALIKDFETTFISMQKLKEKFIFAAVRSCGGCKVG